MSEETPVELPDDAPPMPEHAPDAADSGELERLRAELSELRAQQETAAAEQARTEALSAAQARYNLATPDVFAALGDRVATEDIPAVAEALHNAMAQRITEHIRSIGGTGTGTGGLSPSGKARPKWAGLLGR